MVKDWVSDSLTVSQTYVPIESFKYLNNRLEINSFFKKMAMDESLADIKI